MSEVHEILQPLSDHYRAEARRLGTALRVDASFHGNAASGPMVYACGDLSPFDIADPEDADIDISDFMGDIPNGTVVEWVIDADGSGELHTVVNPNSGFIAGRIGTHTVGRRSKKPAPVVPLTDQVAENDLVEVERLLRERGHSKGFTDKQIAAAEKKRKVTFPPELRLFFSLVAEGVVLDDEDNGLYAEVRDGLTGGTGEVGNVVDPLKRWGRKDALPTMPAATPDDVVQPAYATPHWIVFADDGGGNAYAVDLAPGPKGAIGQIVQFDHEQNQPPGLAATSLTAFLRGEVEIPDAWGPAADAGSVLVHNDSDRLPDERRFTPERALTTTELTVIATEPVLDLGVLRGSRQLTKLVIDSFDPDEESYDLSVLPTLTALEDLRAPEALWAQIVQQDAFPPRLVSVAITESRDLPLAEAVATANAVLDRFGRPTLELVRHRLA